VLIFIPFFIQAEDNAENIINNEAIFIINSFNYDVDGITQEFAINYIDKIKVGHIISGENNLKRYIQEKIQALINERVFDTVRIEYIIGNINEDGLYPVDLLIYVKDTWNIIIMPYPYYSSSSGLNIFLKARDYNFLGLINPLKIDLGFRYKNDNQNIYTFILDTVIPFYIFGYYWRFITENDFNFIPDANESFIYKNKTGISVKFPTGYELFNLGEIIYQTMLSSIINNEYQNWSLDEYKKGPLLEFTHDISFSNINWIGNFRSGTSVNLVNTINYNILKGNNNIQPWNTNIEISGVWHTIINNFLSFSTCLFYKHYFLDDYNDEAGDVLRGILDYDILANYMLSYNFELNFKVLEVRPSLWFDSDFWRIFNFDLHLAPVFCAALYNDPINKITFDFKNIILCGGMELIIFPQMWRSLFLRASFAIGYQASKTDNKYSREIYIGTDFHF